MSGGVQKRIFLLVFLLTIFDCELLRGQRADSLEQQLYLQFDYDDPKGTETRLASLAREAKSAGNTNALAEILSQIARAQALQGHLEEANRTLDRAKAIPNLAVRPQVRILIERGRVLKRQGRVQEARACFEQAYDTASPNELMGLAADAAHMLSIILPFDEARVWEDRGMTMAERSSDPTVRHWVGVIMNNWGGRLDEQGDHQGAALAFARAVAARRLEGDASVTRESEFELAVQLRKLGSAAQALSIQQRLQQEAMSAKEPVGAILLEQVENLLALNRKAEAKQTAEGALRVLQDQAAPAEQIDHLRSVLKELSNVEPR